MLGIHMLPEGRLGRVDEGPDSIRQAFLMETIQALPGFIFLGHLDAVEDLFRSLPPGPIEKDPIAAEGDEIANGLHSISLQLFFGDLVNVSVLEEKGYQSFSLFKNQVWFRLGVRNIFSTRLFLEQFGPPMSLFPVMGRCISGIC